MLIDKLTPNGQLPQAAGSTSTSSMLEAGLGMLKGLGKTGTDA
jgi:hypothetical protein